MLRTKSRFHEYCGSLVQMLSFFIVALNIRQTGQRKKTYEHCKDILLKSSFVFSLQELDISQFLRRVKVTDVERPFPLINMAKTRGLSCQLVKTLSGTLSPLLLDCNLWIKMTLDIKAQQNFVFITLILPEEYS